MPEGFRVELVASEPDIVNPIAMTFDDRGRIFVTESVEYPRKPAGRGTRSRQDPGGPRRRRPHRARYRLRRRDEHSDGRRRRLRRRVGAQRTGPAVPPREGRQGSQPGGRVHRLRPRRHARAAQLAHLGSRWLALRAQRRFQPERRSSQKTAGGIRLPARCGAIILARATFRSSPKGRATRTASPGTPKAAQSSRPATGPTTTCSTLSRPAFTTARRAHTRRSR